MMALFTKHQSRSLFLIFFLSTALCVPAVVCAARVQKPGVQKPGVQKPAAALKPAEPFQQSIENIRKAAESAGVMLVSLPSGRIVFEYNSATALVPASLVKLLTSYAAMKKLGPSFRFGTEALARGEPVDGVIQGDIWIRGAGDPFFVSAKAQELAQAIKDRGIRQITGGVFTDDGFFNPKSEHICLDGDCVGTFNPVVSATAVDFNLVPLRLLVPPKPGAVVTVDPAWAGSYIKVNGRAVSAKKGDTLRVRSLGATGSGQEEFQISGQAASRGPRSREYRFHAADPAGLFAGAIRAALERSGIRVMGQAAGEGTTPPGAVTIARYESPPLSELVASMNKYSNNFMAEMLLKALGGHVSGPPGTSAKGVAVVKSALVDAGIPDRTGMIDCGSGLSRFCLVTPQSFCRLLASAFQDQQMGPAFISSLAVNAGEGTLRRRMRKPGLTVQGKTGTLSDVVAFAGYVSGPSGNTHAAALMLNGVRDRWKARQAIDAFLEEAAFLK